MADSPEALLEMVRQPGYLQMDAWEVFVQAQVQLRADVYLKNSYLADEEVESALLRPCHRIEDTLQELLARYGPDARICVLPDGPQTIPYLAGT
jgi:hypothetical protein